MKSSGWARDGGQASLDKNSHRFARKKSWLVFAAKTAGNGVAGASKIQEIA